MADPDPLVDFLSPDTDESVVNALVASLESRLASPTHTENSQQISATSMNSNHVSCTSSIPACNVTCSSVNAQIKSGVQSVNAASSINSLQSSKSVIKDNQLIGINSILHSSSSVNTGSSPVSIVSCSSGHPSMGKPLESVNKTLTHSIRIVSQPQLSVNQPVLQHTGQFINNTTGSPITSIINDTGDASHDVKPVLYSNSALNDHQRQLILTSDPTGSGIKREVSSPGPQFVVKQEHINSHVKPELIHGLSGKSAQVVPVSVVASQHNTQKTNVHIVHNANIVSSTKALNSNPSVITVRSQNPTTMVVRPPNIMTQTNASSPRPPVTMRVQNRMTTAQPIRIASSSQQSQINIAPRPGTNTITLPPGIVPGPGAVLMKNEQGQIVIVQPGSLPQQSSTTSTLSSSTGQKVQYVRNNSQAQQGMPRGQIVTLQQHTSQPQQTIVRQAIQSPVTAVRPQTRVTVPGSIQHTVVRNNTPGVGVTSVIGQPQQGLTQGQQPIAPANINANQQQMIENVKKCKNFLSTLIKLASSQPATTVRNVRDLIQGLIDGVVEPEVFTEKLQRELKSSPQPYLVPFLKKSLPLLRQSLINNKMTIEGVRAPPVEVLQQHTSVIPQTQASQTLHLTATPTQQVKGRLIGTPAQLQPRSLPAQTVLTGPGKVQMGKQMAISGNIPSTVNTSHNRVFINSHGSSPAAAAAAHAHKEKKKFESLKDDDDINDVATMGGVNLSEETKNILATNAEFIGTQIRSCKDESFLYHNPLLSRITSIAKKYGVTEVPNDVVNIISHATQERLRDVVEKLSTIAEQRSEIYKVNEKFEMVSDVKSQLKFLEELDVLERKRHEEQEKEMLRRAAKSRSKHEDPEQLKLKQKAKELQQAEMEEARQREANMTALAAIGPRKKRKVDTTDSASGSSSSSTVANGVSSSSSRSSLRPRIKRVNLRDVIFLMEQDRSLCKSNSLYKTFLK